MPLSISMTGTKPFGSRAFKINTLVPCESMSSTSEILLHHVVLAIGRDHGAAHLFGRLLLGDKVMDREGVHGNADFEGFIGRAGVGGQKTCRRKGQPGKESLHSRGG